MRIKHYDLAKIYKLYKDIELPIMFISAQMELDGICFDMDYCNRLKVKYGKQLDSINAELDVELKKLEPKILAWRNTDDAKKATVTNSGKEGKSKTEQLKNPPELTSPTQLAILLYDILKCEAVDKKTPRGTGSEILKELAETVPICKLILKQRELLKLMNAFLESLPEKVSPKDGRLHSHFNQLGTDTGRFSCTEPNLQQIPSHNPEIRLLFKASIKEHTVEENNNCYEIPYTDEVEVAPDTWKSVKELIAGDKLFTSTNNYDIIKKIIKNDKIYQLYC